MDGIDNDRDNGLIAKGYVIHGFDNYLEGKSENEAIEVVEGRISLIQNLWQASRTSPYDGHGLNKITVLVGDGVMYIIPGHLFSFADFTEVPDGHMIPSIVRRKFYTASRRPQNGRVDYYVERV